MRALLLASLVVIVFRPGSAIAQHHGGHGGHHGTGGRHHAVHADHMHHAVHYHSQWWGYPYSAGQPYDAGQPYAAGLCIEPARPCAATVPAAPPAPTFGIGIWTSSARAGGATAAVSNGLTLRLPRGALEGALELGKERTLTTGATATRAAAVATVDLAPAHALAPYVLAGVGIRLPDREQGGRQAYLEGGVGLAMRLGAHVTLSGDLRWSMRRDLVERQTAYRATSTESPDLPAGAGLEARLAGIYYF